MTGNSGHKGWYSRGYLPHLDAPGLVQAVTFRLADALPNRVLEAWKDTCEDGEVLRRVAAYLDAGHGSCLLRHARAAAAVEEALLQHDGRRYRLLAWVVMPNHVHALAAMLDGWPLGKIVRAWKGASSRAINRLSGRRGRVWQPGYFDRFIRDEEHLARAVSYIEENPVKAGLVDHPEQWPFSSAARRDEGGQGDG